MAKPNAITAARTFFIFIIVFSFVWTCPTAASFLDKVFKVFNDYGYIAPNTIPWTVKPKSSVAVHASCAPIKIFPYDSNALEDHKNPLNPGTVKNSDIILTPGPARSYHSSTRLFQQHHNFYLNQHVIWNNQGVKNPDDAGVSEPDTPA
jgi:hypothetical protein